MNAPERLDPLVTKTCYLDGSDPEKNAKRFAVISTKPLASTRVFSTASPATTPITRRRRRCDTRSFFTMATPPYFLLTSCMSPN